jgi:hypothetical protein
MVNTMNIGYHLSGDDNDSFFIEDERSLNAPICSKCGRLLDSVNYFNPFFKLKRKIYDFSFTYDQRKIVSLKFKEFCIREAYDGLIFKEFEKEPNFFHFIVNNVVEVDIDRSKPRFEKHCSICGNYDGIYLRDLFLKDVAKELEDGFYRTDLLFSEGNKKQPLFIVGPRTQAKLKQEKLKGVIFRPIIS